MNRLYSVDNLRRLLERGKTHSVDMVETLATQLLDTMRENERLEASMKMAYEVIRKVVNSQPKPYMGYDVDEVREALSNKDSDHGN